MKNKALPSSSLEMVVTLISLESVTFSGRIGNMDIRIRTDVIQNNV